MMKIKHKIISTILAITVMPYSFIVKANEPQCLTFRTNYDNVSVGQKPDWAEGGRSGSSSKTNGAQVEVVADEDGTVQKVLKVDSSYSGNTAVYNYLKIHSDKAFNLADGDVTIVMRAKTSSNMNGNDFFRVFGTTEEDTSTELIGGGMYVGNTNVTVKDNTNKAVLPASTFSSGTYLYFRQTLSDGQYTLEYSTDGTTYTGTQSHTCTTYPEIINGIYFQLPYAATAKSFYIDFVEFKQQLPEPITVVDSIPKDGKMLYGNDIVIKFSSEVSIDSLANAIVVKKGEVALEYGTDYTFSVTENKITVSLENPQDGEYSVTINDKVNLGATGFLKPVTGYSKTVNFALKNPQNYLYKGFGYYFGGEVPSEMICKTYYNGGEYNTANFVIDAEISDDDGAQTGRSAKVVWESKNNTGATGKISIPFGEEFKTAAGDVTVVMRARIKSVIGGSYTKFMGLGGKSGEEDKTLGGLYVGEDAVIYNNSTSGLAIFSSLDDFSNDEYIYFRQVVSEDSYTCSISNNGESWYNEKTAELSDSLDSITSVDFILPNGNHSSEVYIDYIAVSQDKYPIVESSSPFDGEQFIAYDSPILLNMNCLVDGASVNSTNIMLVKKHNGVVSECQCDYSLTGENNIIQVIPQDGLTKGASYVLTVSGLVMDDGSGKTMKKEHKISFTVGGEINIKSVNYTREGNTIEADIKLTEFLEQNKDYVIIAMLWSADSDGIVSVEGLQTIHGNYTAGFGEVGFYPEFESDKEKLTLTVMVWDKYNRSTAYTKKVTVDIVE